MYASELISHMHTHFTHTRMIQHMAEILRQPINCDKKTHENKLSGHLHSSPIHAHHTLIHTHIIQHTEKICASLSTAPENIL